LRCVSRRARCEIMQETTLATDSCTLAFLAHCDVVGCLGDVQIHISGLSNLPTSVGVCKVIVWLYPDVSGAKASPMFASAHPRASDNSS
jgi:hypothetical protein